MSRTTRQMRNTRSAVSIMIQGKKFDVTIARIVFKCFECHGDLELFGAGVRCKADHDHRRFIHREELAKLEEEEKAELTEIESAYEIVNGQIVSKEK